MRIWLTNFGRVVQTRVVPFVLLHIHACPGLSQEPESATEFQDRVRPVLAKFCGECHGPDAENSFRFLAAETADDVAAGRPAWASVMMQLRNRTMPPKDQPQPSERDRLHIADWIDGTLKSTACRDGELIGSVPPRRLNRREYQNTIRDLLGVQIDANILFPVDGSGGEGFDNHGGTLFLSPLLMERYLEVSDRILDRAVSSPPLAVDFGPADFNPPSRAPAALRKGKRVRVTLRVYRPGTYVVRLVVNGSPEVIDIRADGINVARLRRENSDGGKGWQARLRLTRGRHVLSVGGDGHDVGLQRISVEEAPRRQTDASRRRHARWFGAIKPGVSPPKPGPAARRILRAFATHAYRRPPSELESVGLTALFDRARRRGDPFEEAVKLAMKAVLLSPHFLFRTEPTNGEDGEDIHYATASRLSYFLWNSMPDAELFDRAADGRLSDPDELTRQVDRMLADPKAKSFFDDFVGQWLGTRDVGGRVAPDTNRFRDDFTTELLLDLREEPVRFFEYLVRHDRTALELIRSDYVIVNNRLAHHYGLVNANSRPKGKSWPWSANPKRGSGGPFRRFELSDERRGGVVGMGAVHLLTSRPARTSPVLRGAWVLDTLLGVRVPIPPPGIPELKRSRRQKRTVRQQLVLHRQRPSCAACHDIIDPAGFALSNFDVLGRWRDREGAAKIDASAKLPSGDSFSGPDGLRSVLLKRSDEFVSHLTRKLFGYALGRSLEPADDCAIQRIARAAHREDDKLRTIIRRIVLSPAFRRVAGQR